MDEDGSSTSTGRWGRQRNVQNRPTDSGLHPQAQYGIAPSSTVTQLRRIEQTSSTNFNEVSIVLPFIEAGCVESTQICPTLYAWVMFIGRQRDAAQARSGDVSPRAEGILYSKSFGPSPVMLSIRRRRRLCIPSRSEQIDRRYPRELGLAVYPRPSRSWAMSSRPSQRSVFLNRFMSQC